jgi:hypothetical protein
MSAPFLLCLLHSRARLLLHVLLLAAAVVLALGVLPTGTASAAAPAVAQCNGSDNVGGEEVRCDVTVTNTLDLATGVGSSTVTVQECHGAAGAPTCGPMTTSTFADVTTAVSQCNGSGGGGGGVVACTVRITSTVTGAATTSPATVNQCNVSGQGGGTQPTVQCSPIGSTTSATVTQCNDAGNGGGATLRVRCDVEPSTQSTVLPVTIDQCNGSGNGGGATVTCRSAVTTTVQAAAVVPTASASPSATSSPSPSAGPSPSASPDADATPAATASPTPTSALPLATPPASTPTAAPDSPGPVAGAPVGGSPAGPATGPQAPGPLPDGSLPVAQADDSSTTVDGSVQLPRTGIDLASLTQLGLLLAGVGGALLLLLARTPRPVGRHEHR